MTKLLILGAGGQIAKQVIGLLVNDPGIRLTLYLRHARKLGDVATGRAIIVEADVTDHKKLKEAMQGQDIVYANLDGPVDKLAQNILRAMQETAVRRLIFISSLGIYDEVPGAFGKWNKRMIGQYLGPHRKAAGLIEASDLNYTILRPAWLTDYDEVDYEITQKGEAFKGTEVSRKSVASLVVKLVKTPEWELRKSLGVNKPHTEGDKPAFY